MVELFDWRNQIIWTVTACAHETVQEEQSLIKDSLCIYFW